MTGPAKTDATTPCQHCSGTMKLSMIEPLPAEPTLMQHNFVCQSCGAMASYKFKKKGVP